LDERVGDLYVVDRAGYVVYENHRDSVGALQHPAGIKQAIHAERNRPPTLPEVKAFWRTAEPLQAAASRMHPEVRQVVLAALERYDERPGPQADLERTSPAQQLVSRITADRDASGAWQLATSGLVIPSPTPAQSVSADVIRRMNPHRPALEL
jgi:hypothetical protein